MSDARNRSPEELEREIDRTRADIDRTLALLQARISPGAVLDQVLRSTRDGGGDFGASLGRAVRENPLPVGLLGVSLAWLLFSGRNTNGTTQTLPPDGAGREDPNRPFFDDAPRNQDGREPGATFRAEAGEAADTAPGLRNTVADATSDFYDKADRTVDQAREQAGGYDDQAAERAEGVRRQPADVRVQTGDQADGALHTVRGFVRDHPLVVGALAVALGAALAALIPAKRREAALTRGDREPVEDAAVREVAEEPVDRSERTDRSDTTIAEAEAKGQDPQPDELQAERDDEAKAVAKAGTEPVGTTDSNGRSDPASSMPASRAKPEPASPTSGSSFPGEQKA